MDYCNRCSHKLAYGAKFCSNCGTPVGVNYSQNQSERRNEYAGTVIQCPACRENIPSFTAICPACGHEINSAKLSASLRNFIKQIEACDKKIANSSGAPQKGWNTWKTWQKIGWVILNLYFIFIPLLVYLLFPYLKVYWTPSLTREEHEKAAIIQNYTFPNDRGSILDALLFIKSKVGFLVNEKTNAKNAYWMRLWTKKAEQLHQKAELLFPGDKIANDTYAKISADRKQVQKKVKTRVGLIVGVIVIAFILFSVRGYGGSSSDSKGAALAWPTNEFTEVLPEPTIKTGKVTREYEKSFEFELHNISAEDFENYVIACRDVGFTVDISKTDSVFYAKDVNGYDLRISYHDNKDEMSIKIDSYNLKKIVKPIETTPVNIDFAMNIIEKDSEYTFMCDKWNLYVATAISDTLIRIENWGKSSSSSKSVEYEYDVGTYKITDETNGFSWLDDEHTAFVMNLQDKNNGNIKEQKTAVFTISTSSSSKFKGSNYSKREVCYSLQNDDWHLYRAIPLTGTTIKIEVWCRTSSSDSFIYGYDLGTINSKNTASDFAWTDDEHTAFTITIQDAENSRLEEPSFVAFTIDK